jgi:hypothetical protein
MVRKTFRHFLPFETQLSSQGNKNCVLHDRGQYGKILPRQQPIKLRDSSKQMLAI